MKRYTISARRKAKFERRDGETSEQWVARQMTMASPFELAWLGLIRDDTQRTIMQTVASARAARWARWAVVVALLSVPINVAVSLLT